MVKGPIHEEIFAAQRAKQRRELDRCLAEMDQAAADLAAACERAVDEIRTILRPDEPSREIDEKLTEWLADNVRAKIDTIADEKRRSIKTLRAMIEIVENFDPPPVRLPPEE